MPSYTILPSSTPKMIHVDITHDDGTVRKDVGFIFGKDINYSDEASLKAELARVVQANQDTHYAIKAGTLPGDAMKAKQEAARAALADTMVTLAPPPPVR